MKSVATFELSYLLLSPSTRRVWIEIRFTEPMVLSSLPSPSTRRVWIEISLTSITIPGGLSHPPHGGCGLKWTLFLTTITAASHPPHGGCGLKCTEFVPIKISTGSPSTRRVWIEMKTLPHLLQRNFWSPSTRRVWIEIFAGAEN